jgi:16S rRNA G527 N7-methylase RsmG
MPSEVAQALAAAGIELEEGDAAKLQRYLQALLDANERFPPRRGCGTSRTA